MIQCNQKTDTGGRFMKKFVPLTTLLAVLSLSLTSCELAHFGEKKIYAPWWICLIVICVIIVVTFAVLLKILSSKYRTCPKCNHKFRPKWYNCFAALFIVEDNSARLFKCPKCKEKSLMDISYEQEEK